MGGRTLYPLKFKPILKDVIWGGTRMKTVLNKPVRTDHCGESWEISGVQDHISIVENGFLAGNSLQELIEVYMGDLLGDHVYEHFGPEFPLLIKFIDANQFLSIQVHPDDALAMERHNAYGKTEMWYIVEAEPGAELISGFSASITKDQYLSHFQAKSLPEILNYEKVRAGDVFFTPAGRVHAIGPGILLAEIQQTSDITYRIYDWDRVDASGKERDLHTDLALEAIEYNDPNRYRRHADPAMNSRETAWECEYFNTSVMCLDRRVEKVFNYIDSFVTYMCLEGNGSIRLPGGSATPFRAGDTLLVPAAVKNIEIRPEIPVRMLEIYIP